jgi:hypothetical protein
LKAVAFIFALNFRLILGVPLELPRQTQFNCENITIPVTISALNAYIPPGSTVADLTAILDAGLTFNVSVEGTFDIAATFCEPQQPNSFPDRINTLQVLVHGGTYTRTFVRDIYSLYLVAMSRKIRLHSSKLTLCQWSGDGAPGCGYDGNTYSCKSTNPPAT